MLENPRTKDFRNVFSNIFTMQFGDNDVRITFGHVLDSTAPVKVMIEEVSVFMTPRSAKMMMLALKNTIERFEQVAGTPIQLPPGKLEETENALTVVVAQAEKPST